jgi:hypothetical protein
MKKFLCVNAMLLFLSVSYSQLYQEKGPKPKIVENTLFRFNLLSPGFDFELGLFKNQTILGGVGLGGTYYNEGYTFGLGINAQYRYYYNLDRRIKNDKIIGGNSGNYIGAARSIFFSQLRISTDIDGPKDFNIGYYGLIYGIQRTYKKGFSFDISSGLGYYLGDGIPSGYGPILNLKFGWVLTKRKSKSIHFQ